MIVHRHVMFVLAVVTALVTPVAASAAIRVASPGGAPSTACPTATPCNLDTAVNSAIDGDEIVLLAGVSTGFPSLNPGGRVLNKRLTLRLTLDEAANVKITIERMTPGRHVGARCVPESKTGAKCVKLTRVTTFSRAFAAAGLAKVVVPAKPGGKKLQRGTYRLVVRATDAAANSSPAKRITFTVA